MYSQSVVRGALLVMHLIFPIWIPVLHAPLIALVFQIPAGGFAVTAAHADEDLYPGRYVAHCKQSPIGGCVCTADSAGPTPQLAQSTQSVDPDRIRDPEYLRMLEWLRLTCSAVTGSEVLH
jgi:hypothetical protein